VTGAQIEKFIVDSANMIDELTSRKWSECTATKEIYDYDGSDILQLRNWPVLSVDLLEYNDGTGSWETQTEDPNDGDYYASPDDLERGQIRILDPPSQTLESIRVTYTYGASSTPYKIRHLCTLMAAVQTYRAMTGPGQRNIYSDEIKVLQAEIDKILSTLGGEMNAYVAPLASKSVSWPGRTKYGLWALLRD